MTKLEGFELRQRAFTKADIEVLGQSVYHLGTSHRQLFHFDRYPGTRIFVDNASNCLAGFCCVRKGIFVFHDPPMQALFNEPPFSRRDRGEGLIGGSKAHWEATQSVYNRNGIMFTYVEKQEGHIDNTDYSFAFLLDMGEQTIDYGYYHNPKGLSGDGWMWEEGAFW